MKQLTYVLLISILFASIGQVGSDLYLPSLPAIGVALHASHDLVQTTMFLFMLGFAASRLFYGPASDAIGRKKPLILGLSFYLAGTIICTISPSVWILMLGRFLQGLGAGGGVVLANAIVRDLLTGETLAQAFSYMSLTNVLFISSAPLMGGYIQHLFGWRYNFVFLSIIAIVALIFGLFVFKETNQHQTTSNLKPQKIKQNLKELFTSKQYIIYGIFIFIAYGGFTGWLTLAPIILHIEAGITPVQFGWVGCMGGGFYALGLIVNSTIGRSTTVNQRIAIGIICFFVASTIMFCFALLHMLSFWEITAPMMLYMFGGSFIFPNAFAGALTPFGKIAGIASAVVGYIQISGGALTSGVISASPDNTQLPLAIMLLTTSFIAIVSYYFLIRNHD